MSLPQTFINKFTSNAIVETPRGCVNKYAFDKNSGLFKLKKVLPAGSSFPMNFGFIPHTVGEDGDPLDVLILTDEACYPGCIVECNCIGVMAAQQSEGSKLVRNDRLMAVSTESLRFAKIKTSANLGMQMINDLVHFFENYNRLRGKKFIFSGFKNKNAAIALIKKSMIDDRDE